MLRRLQSLKFIRVIGETDDPGSLLVLYPSIPYIFEGRDIEELWAAISIGGDEAGEEEE